MSLRTVLVGVFALVFGLAAALGVYLIGPIGPETTTTELVSVIVAKADISRGQTISAELLEERPWPKNALPDGAVTAQQSVVDRSVLMPISKGELILEIKLASKDAGRGMAAIVPPGMRAVTIQTPNVASGVAGFILPGNKVDVLLTVSSQGADDPSGGATTFTLLQNIEILAVDQRIEAPQENKMDPKELRSVTLMVTPTEAAKLDLGQNQGTLQLALRNSADQAITTVKPATLSGLNGNGFARAEMIRETVQPVAVTPTVISASVSKPPPPVIIQRVWTLRGLQSGVVSFQPLIADGDAPPTEELPGADDDSPSGPPTEPPCT